MISHECTCITIGFNFYKKKDILNYCDIFPGNKQTDPMARSAEAHFRQTDMKSEADTIIYGHNKLRRPKAGQPLAVCNIIY